VPYLSTAFLPALARLGVNAALTLRRWGWYPAGGGEVDASIMPSSSWRSLHWEQPTGPLMLEGISAVSRLPRSIAERQRARALDRLGAGGWGAEIIVLEDMTALGPGTMLMLTAAGDSARAGFSALGRRGVRAETVADEALDPLLEYLRAAACVDSHLADQLVPFLALADGPSTFTCPTVSSHLRTVAWLVEQMLPVRVTLVEDRRCRVVITPAPRPAARSRAGVPPASP
jgi:RNA 3'-phosphate cyclase